MGSKKALIIEGDRDIPDLISIPVKDLELKVDVSQDSREGLIRE